MAAQLPAGGRQGAGAGERRRPRRWWSNTGRRASRSTWGWCSPSPHNYELRYWLAAGGLNPGFYAPKLGDNSGQRQADVLLSVTPPPQMPATLEAGTIAGYSVGSPGTSRRSPRIGVPVITDQEIWRNNPEKVFGVT